MRQKGKDSICNEINSWRIYTNAKTKGQAKMKSIIWIQFEKAILNSKKFEYES